MVHQAIEDRRAHGVVPQICPPVLHDASKYPPAKPGALGLGPLKAAVGVANATLGGLTERSRIAATAQIERAETVNIVRHLRSYLFARYRYSCPSIMNSFSCAWWLTSREFHDERLP